MYLVKGLKVFNGNSKDYQRKDEWIREGLGEDDLKINKFQVETIVVVGGEGARRWHCPAVGHQF